MTPAADDTASSVAFAPVARAGDIPAGQGRTFEVAGRLVAVFFDGQAYHAMDDLCPHMGASLGSGPFVDGVVTCPWHAWRFRACDGSWCDNEKLRVDVFEVRVVGDSIEVRVPPPRPIEIPTKA
jgi:nitrite reductase (NADH) small subunit/3-phenylpropionate/trans-cinnamate dioxygenase ferredoxin subunit